MVEVTGNTRKRHPIRVAAARAGLTPGLLRVWEARYGAVEPGRTEKGQRRYSDDDIEQLRLLQAAVQGGRRIGDVASLERAELEAIVQEDRRETTRTFGGDVGVVEGSAGILSACLDAVERSDVDQLRHSLDRALLGLSAIEAVQEVVSPLMRRLGEMWAQGRIDPAHEHLATVIVRQVLIDAALSIGPSNGHQRIVIATPAGQMHDVGALEATLCAAAEGWGVTYLGADLPASSIARAARDRGARMVALSIVHPDDDPDLVPQIEELSQTLDEDVVLAVGGWAATKHADRFRSAGAILMNDFADLRDAMHDVNGRRR